MKKFRKINEILDVVTKYKSKFLNLYEIQYKSKLGNGGSDLRDVISQSPVNKGMVVTQIYIQACFIDKLFFF